MKRKSITSIYVALGLLFLVIFAGISGYMIIEDMNFTQAFYMTVITVATVGFQEVKPLSGNGMYFTAILIVFSFGIFGYTVTTLIQYMVDGTVRNLFIDKRVKRKISNLINHVVVCGYGRNGRQSVSELQTHGVPVVVVESDEKVVEQIRRNSKLLYIQGDATHDSVLHSCQLETAKALITTLPVDAHNLFVVLTAREISSSLDIISRASDEHSDIKLKRAGATNVIMPDKIGGQRMAKLVVQPDIVEFLEFIMLQSIENVALEEILCQNVAPCFNNIAMRELDEHNDSGATIIGMKRSDSSMVINPLPELILTPEDKLFALGTKSQIQRLRKLMVDGI